MKKLIRLTESDLHRIVKQSVKRIIREENDKNLLVQRVCAKYSTNGGEYEGGWPANLDEWIPVEAYISHVDGDAGTANLRIGEQLNGGTAFEEEIPLSQLPIETLEMLL